MALALTSNGITVSVEENKSKLVLPIESDGTVLASTHRIRRNQFETKSIDSSTTSYEEENGWEIQREGKRKTRVKRKKDPNLWLEDRVWSLLYSMGYQTLNSHRLTIEFDRSDKSSGKKNISVYAEDNETAIVVECKSREERGRRKLFKDIEDTISLQSHIRSAINGRFKSKPKPKIIWIYATNNIIWSSPDVERADKASINIITENELQYFETFIKHMGPAGRYQILGEFLKGQKVPGLSNVRLPAIRGKIGGETFYSFVATPRNLLKIAFVNHQALNHPDGRPAYQRMISSSRIKDISGFIKKGGYFPTNILVNFSESPRFDLISNKENTDGNIKFGWLTLPSKYRSAWIIDGQHRIYGYSHLDDYYLDQNLFVLAFNEMPVQKEADLFITINHKQKSVPRSLLVSLLADIRLGDSDPSTALSALASAIVRALNTDKTSPLARRFAIHGVPPEPTQNLTISEAVNGLRRSGLIGKVVGKSLAPGSLSGATDEATVERASIVLGTYFEAVRNAHPKRWEDGRNAFVATNPGIRAHLTMISEVVAYLARKDTLDFALLSEEDYAKYIVEFCRPVFLFINEATDEEIKSRFSRRFGEGGVKEYTYHLMQILAEVHEAFGTEDFKRWVEQSDSEKIDEINQFLMKFAERLTDYVINTLKEIHGTRRLESGEQAFWEVGVESERVRKNAFSKQQQDKVRRKPKEAYLDIIDLMEIVKQNNNWNHFERTLKNARPNEKRGQKHYLGWIQVFNDVRNIAAHKNQMKIYTDDDLEFVEWLRTEVSPKIPA